MRAADLARRLRLHVEGVQVTRSSELVEEDHRLGAYRDLVLVRLGAQQAGQGESEKTGPSDSQQIPPRRERLAIFATRRIEHGKTHYRGLSAQVRSKNSFPFNKLHMRSSSAARRLETAPAPVSVNAGDRNSCAASRSSPRGGREKVAQ